MEKSPPDSLRHAQSETALLSLAMLKVNWDEQKSDYIENFVPFVVEAAMHDGGTIIANDDLQARILAEFGILIPRDALRTIVRRAIKRGLLVTQNQTVVVAPETVSNGSFLPRRNELLAEQRQLLADLAEYANSAHGLHWSEEEAEAALLRQVEKSAMPILATAVGGAPLELGHPPQGAALVVGGFVKRAFDQNPARFSQLERLVKGSMLAHALYYPDISSAATKLKDFTAVFDTQVVFNALGYSGAEFQGPAKELVDLVRQLGGTVACLQATVGEMRGILRGAEATAGRPPVEHMWHGSVDAFFREAGLSASDIKSLNQRLDLDIHALGIRIADAPLYERQNTLDEEALEQVLQEHVGYRRDPTRAHDVSCITATYRMRSGAVKNHIEDCNAIFVTTNTSLARASTRFARTNYGLCGSIPLCIASHTLATLLWLKKPAAAPELPRNVLVANALAGLAPSPAMWRRYLGECERMRRRGVISDDEYQLLRDATDVEAVLMQVTLGEPAAVTEGTVQQVLQRAKHALRADLQHELAQASEHARALGSASRQRRSRLQARINFAGKAVEVGLLVTMVSLLEAAVLLGTYAAAGRASATSVRLLIYVGGCVAFALSVVATIWGTTVKQIAHAVARPASRRLRLVLWRVLWRA